MSVAYDHNPELHRIVDRLDPQQADEVSAYALRLIKGGKDERREPPHRLSFTGIGSSDNPNLAAEAKDIIRRELRGLNP
jgi:hypothetical protein